MHTRAHVRLAASPLVALALLAGASAVSDAQSTAAPTMSWPIHSMDRPKPPVVTPGAFVSAPPPSDAIVLFDGKSLGAWRSANDPTKPAAWKVQDGYMEVVAGAGAVTTAQGFGDVQLHIEWMAPTPPKGESQERGNSGVFLMGRYELQVLDSYQNPTYADGQAGALYGQYPPLVNASRPPGQWQSYDVVFRRPHFDAQGKVVRPARMTVLFNGVLVQDSSELTGPTAHQRRPPYEAHADALPITLQDHGDPVRFRNVWVRPLPAVAP